MLQGSVAIKLVEVWAVWIEGKAVSIERLLNSAASAPLRAKNIFTQRRKEYEKKQSILNSANPAPQRANKKSHAETQRAQGKERGYFLNSASLAPLREKNISKTKTATVSYGGNINLAQKTLLPPKEIPNR